MTLAASGVGHPAIGQIGLSWDIGVAFGLMYDFQSLERVYTVS